jgi:hypothetical protein
MKLVALGMKALLADGATCSVVDVLIDPRNGRERYLVLDANGCFGQDVVVPAAYVWQVDSCVHLTLSSAELRTLPHSTDIALDREGPLRSCAAVRHRAHWPYRAGQHYLHTP